MNKWIEDDIENNKSENSRSRVVKKTYQEEFSWQMLIIKRKVRTYSTIKTN